MTRALAEGVNVAEGQLTYGPVGEAHGLEVTPLVRLLD